MVVPGRLMFGCCISSYDCGCQCGSSCRSHLFCGVGFTGSSFLHHVGSAILLGLPDAAFYCGRLIPGYLEAFP